MTLDIELTDKDIENLDRGGFIVVILEGGYRVIVKKD